MRQNFAKTVMRGKAELGITMTTNSPINGLLETAIQEVCHNYALSICSLLLHFVLVLIVNIVEFCNYG